MAEIKSIFAPDGDLEPDVLGELESMARLHNISAEDLYFKWESYCIAMDRDAQDVGLVAVRQLKQTMQDALETSQRQQVKSERKMLSAKTKPRAMGMLDGLVSMPSTPTSGTDRRIQTPGSGTIRRKTEAASDAMKALSVRAQPGEVLEVLNETLAAATPPDGAYAESRIKLTAASDQKKMGYKTMAMKLSEASEMLDERIEEFSELVREHHGLEESALGNAATAGTAEIVAVGRIASDSLEGRLNAASIVLETSRGAGRGLRVPLNLGGVRDWAFFPGQMVALRGGNASGKEFTVREVLEMPLLPSAASTPAVLAAHRERMRGDAMDVDGEPRPLSIVYASGPYTPDDNLDYEPLRALCAQAAETLADALVLTGPFLDADHPLIATGDFDLPDVVETGGDTATMATAFRHLVAPAIQRLAAANPSMAIVLVPSVRDVLNRHVAWPQDALVRRELGLPRSVRVVSNPMTLSLNEVVLAVSSQDVLFELRSEEVSRGVVARDVMARLARYLIEQRHYFPVFPPVARGRLPRTGTEEGVGMGAVLDLGYLKLGEMVSVRPDVMMVPSSLPPFAKVIESVVVINPGHLSKRRGPGTFARMTLHAPSTSGETVDGVACHGVFNRARVEIVRI